MDKLLLLGIFLASAIAFVQADRPLYFYRDCSEVWTKDRKPQGVHPSDMTGLHTLDLGEKLAKVFCNMTYTEGWTLIMHRMNGEVNFDRDMDAYRDGFGNLMEEFWLGLENIYLLTNQATYTLRIMVQTNEGVFESRWRTFRIGDETENYKLYLGGYMENSTAGDYLTKTHNDTEFTTPEGYLGDDKASETCWPIRSGGWWATPCDTSNLNARYGCSEHDCLKWFPPRIGHEIRVITMSVMRVYDTRK